MDPILHRRPQDLSTFYLCSFNFWTSSPFMEQLSRVLRITISYLCCPLKTVLRLVVLKHSAFLTHRSQQRSKASFSPFHSFLPWMLMKKILCTRNGSEIRALRKCPGSSCPASHVSCVSKVPSNQQGCHWGSSLILVTCLKRKIVSQNRDNSKWKSSVSVNSMEANRHGLVSEVSAGYFLYNLPWPRVTWEEETQLKKKSVSIRLTIDKSVGCFLD